MNDCTLFLDEFPRVLQKFQKYFIPFKTMCFLISSDLLIDLSQYEVNHPQIRGNGNPSILSGLLEIGSISFLIISQEGVPFPH